MTSRCPGPSVVWGSRGRGPRKPARKAAEPRAGKAGRAQALRAPLSYFQDGGERRRPRHLGGSAHHLPPTAPVVSPEHGGVEGNGLGEAQGRPREGPRGEKMLLPLSSTRWEAAWKGGCVLGQTPGLSLSQPFADRPPAWSLGPGDCSLPASAVPVAPLSPLLGHPPKLRIWGQGRAGKVHSSPALPPSQPRSLQLVPVPSRRHSPGRPPAAPVSQRIWESGDLLERRAALRLGWRADGEGACRGGDAWGDRDLSGWGGSSQVPISFFVSGTGVIGSDLPLLWSCQESP